MFENNLSLQFSEENSSLIEFKIDLDVHSQAIHDHALQGAKKYLIAEAELLASIIEVDRHRVFEKFGLTHLTPYCVKHLGLSEDVAGNFVRVARKSQQVPELQCAIDEGRLTVSKAKTIVSVLTTKNQDEWIEKAGSLSKEKLEREVAKVSPYSFKQERAKPVGADMIRVEFELTEEEMKLFRRAQDLVSQKSRKSASLKETAVELLKSFLERHDPVRKAERSLKRTKGSVSHPSRGGPEKGQVNARTTSSVATVKSRPELNPGISRRKPLPAAVRHDVHRRDKGQCQAKLPDGSRCGQQRWVDVHHKTEKSHGGQDTLDNLITLCSSHHRMLHKNIGQAGKQADRSKSRNRFRLQFGF